MCRRHPNRASASGPPGGLRVSDPGKQVLKGRLHSVWQVELRCGPPGPVRPHRGTELVGLGGVIEGGAV